MSLDKRRPNPTKGTRPLTFNGQGGIQRGERVRLGGVRIDWREESNFEGERGVLRLGMVSEGW